MPKSCALQADVGRQHRSFPGILDVFCGKPRLSFHFPLSLVVTLVLGVRPWAVEWWLLRRRFGVGSRSRLHPGHDARRFPEHLGRDFPLTFSNWTQVDGDAVGRVDTDSLLRYLARGEVLRASSREGGVAGCH